MTSFKNNGKLKLLIIVGTRPEIIRLAEGVTVLPRAVVNTGCTVCRGCIINCGAIVDHGCTLEEGVHLAPGAIVKAENRIPACTKVDSGEVIANRTYPL